MLMMTRIRPWLLIVLTIGVILVATVLIMDHDGGLALFADVPLTESELTTLLAAKDPDTIVAQLATATSLEQAAQEFAILLEVPLSMVRVRLRDSGCAVCEMKENSQLGDMSVTEAQEQMANSDAFWLVVDDFLCFYQVSNGELIPRSCGRF